MSEPNNGQNQQQPRPQTKAEIVTSVNKSVCSALLWVTGAKPPASVVYLKDAYLTGWCATAGNSPNASKAPHPRELLSPVVGVVTPAESLQERLKHDAEATRVGLSTATRKA